MSLDDGRADCCTCRIERALGEAEFKATTDMEDDPELRLKILGDDKARIKEGKLIHRLAARIRIKCVAIV